MNNRTICKEAITIRRDHLRTCWPACENPYVSATHAGGTIYTSERQSGYVPLALPHVLQIFSPADDGNVAQYDSGPRVGRQASDVDPEAMGDWGIGIKINSQIRGMGGGGFRPSRQGAGAKCNVWICGRWRDKAEYFRCRGDVR